MSGQMKDLCKWGVGFMLGWNVLILSIYILDCLLSGVPFTENMEVDSWSAFWVCYAFLSLMCFYIGYALRKEFITKKETYVACRKEQPQNEVERIYRLNFVRRYSKLFTRLVFVAILYNIFIHIQDDRQIRYFVNVGIFLGGMILCYCITRRITHILEQRQ